MGEQQGYRMLPSGLTFPANLFGKPGPLQYQTYLLFLTYFYQVILNDELRLLPVAILNLLNVVGAAIGYSVTTAHIDTERKK
ncbi:hypothetical protein [uncultured Kiloniella sp.]|uniref:hypothetical protein n=1 Tax=uncultured Kiloniella sp. TaxID=1133091 RepID=UPI002617B70D|nr:hypothetical protein [uncultured Kiloniella sp.]